MKALCMAGIDKQTYFPGYLKMCDRAVKNKSGFGCGEY